ncbi:MAG TPA: inositol monophosphatase family protein [Anaerolineaceae bacterium]|nr:inositol monophosphatase family protein [Anaerolineaceae bacterium]
MTPSLAMIEDWARQAGKILSANFGCTHSIDHKGITDLVTEVDRQSEDLLVGLLHKNFPSHTILTEESGLLKAENSQKVWYIDPLDGTTNYAHNLPIFSISIAYAEDGVVKMGLVYDPMRDECFSAQLGGGATLNGVPMHVSNTHTLIESLLVTGFPYDTLTSSYNNLDFFSRFSMLTQGVRRLGSAALDLAYVAAGRLDGYWEIKLKPWDVAAGALLVQEAGGIVTGMRGQPDFMVPPNSVLAANSILHPMMLDILEE